GIVGVVLSVPSRDAHDRGVECGVPRASAFFVPPKTPRQRDRTARLVCPRECQTLRGVREFQSTERRFCRDDVARVAYAAAHSLRLYRASPRRVLRPADPAAKRYSEADRPERARINYPR